MGRGTLPPLDGRLDIFPVTHHGSKYATPVGLLSATRPRYAILSTGPNGSAIRRPKRSTA
jgi:beta-lactamase superfamily II metal-dependent hydrolase